MSTYKWIEGRWPREKAKCYFEAGKDGKFRGEVVSSGDGYDIKLRYQGVQVCSDYLKIRGEGALELAKDSTEKMFERVKEDING